MAQSLNPLGGCIVSFNDIATSFCEFEESKRIRKQYIEKNIGGAPRMSKLQLQIAATVLLLQRGIAEPPQFFLARILALGMYYPVGIFQLYETDRRPTITGVYKTAAIKDLVPGSHAAVGIVDSLVLGHSELRTERDYPAITSAALKIDEGVVRYENVEIYKELVQGLLLMDMHWHKLYREAQDRPNTPTAREFARRVHEMLVMLNSGYSRLYYDASLAGSKQQDPVKRLQQITHPAYRVPPAEPDRRVEFDTRRTDGSALGVLAARIPQLVEVDTRYEHMVHVLYCVDEIAVHIEKLVTNTNRITSNIRRELPESDQVSQTSIIEYILQSISRIATTVRATVQALISFLRSGSLPSSSGVHGDSIVDVLLSIFAELRYNDDPQYPIVKKFLVLAATELDKFWDAARRINDANYSNQGHKLIHVIMVAAASMSMLSSVLVSVLNGTDDPEDFLQQRVGIKVEIPAFGELTDYFNALFHMTVAFENASEQLLGLYDAQTNPPQPPITNQQIKFSHRVIHILWLATRGLQHINKNTGFDASEAIRILGNRIDSLAPPLNTADYDKLQEHRRELENVVASNEYSTGQATHLAIGPLGAVELTIRRLSEKPGAFASLYTSWAPTLWNSRSLTKHKKSVTKEAGTSARVGATTSAANIMSRIASSLTKSDMQKFDAVYAGRRPASGDILKAIRDAQTQQAGISATNTTLPEPSLVIPQDTTNINLVRQINYILAQLDPPHQAIDRLYDNVQAAGVSADRDRVAQYVLPLLNVALLSYKGCAALSHAVRAAQQKIIEINRGATPLPYVFKVRGSVQRAAIILYIHGHTPDEWPSFEEDIGAWLGTAAPPLLAHLQKLRRLSLDVNNLSGSTASVAQEVLVGDKYQNVGKRTSLTKKLENARARLAAATEAIANAQSAYNRQESAVTKSREQYQALEKAIEQTKSKAERKMLKKQRKKDGPILKNEERELDRAKMLLSKATRDKDSAAEEVSLFSRELEELRKNEELEEQRKRAKEEEIKATSIIGARKMRGRPAKINFSQQYSPHQYEDQSVTPVALQQPSNRVRLEQLEDLQFSPVVQHLGDDSDDVLMPSQAAVANLPVMRENSYDDQTYITMVTTEGQAKPKEVVMSSSSAPRQPQPPAAKTTSSLQVTATQPASTSSLQATAPPTVLQHPQAVLDDIRNCVLAGINRLYTNGCPFALDQNYRYNIYLLQSCNRGRLGNLDESHLFYTENELGQFYRQMNSLITDGTLMRMFVVQTPTPTSGDRDYDDYVWVTTTRHYEQFLEKVKTETIRTSFNLEDDTRIVKTAYDILDIIVQMLGIDETREPRDDMHAAAIAFVNTMRGISVGARYALDRWEIQGITASLHNARAVDLFEYAITRGPPDSPLPRYITLVVRQVLDEIYTYYRTNPVNAGIIHPGDAAGGRRAVSFVPASKSTVTHATSYVLPAHATATSAAAALPPQEDVDIITLPPAVRMHAVEQLPAMYSSSSSSTLSSARPSVQRQPPARIEPTDKAAELLSLLEDMDDTWLRDDDDMVRSLLTREPL